MGKYDKYKRLIIPANIAKTQVTSSVLGVGKRLTTAGMGNEGIDLGEWFQEQIDNGDIVITVPGTGTDLSFLRTSTDVTIYSSTGADITIQGAGSTLAGFMTAPDKINLTGLLALDGVANGATNLGTFTGTIISDNNTIKGALQELETALGSISVGGNGIYGGSDNIPTGTIATQLGTFGIDTVGITGNTLKLGGITGIPTSRYGFDLTHNQLKLGNVFGTIAQGLITINSTGASLSGTGGNLNLLLLNSIGGGELDITNTFTIYDAGLGQGLVYSSDLSSTFVPLSLVTKQYVDTAVAGGSLTHNTLIGLQGGISGEYYHLTDDQHSRLTSINQGEILGRYDPGNGDVQVLTTYASITTNFTDQTIELVNDVANPGNSKMYGTDSSGVRGWYNQVSGSGTVTSVSVTDNSNLDFTITGSPTINPTITADLKTTGVTANTYGNSSNVAQFTVDNKGRLSSAVNVPISITTSNITGFDEYVQDLMSTTLVAGSGVTLIYNDPTGTITISSTGSYSDEQAQDAVGTIMLNTSDVEFIYNDSWPKITAILADTGVTAGTYGSSSQVPVFVNDIKGRLYSVSNTPISITATQVSNFDEAVDDRVSNLLVAGSNVSLSYNDIAGTLTISSTGGGGGAGGYDTIKHDGSMLTQRTVVDFLGDAFVIADNSGATKTEISLASILENLADIVTPATGSMLYYTGSIWTKVLPTRDVQSVSSGVTVTLPTTPKTGTIVDVYFNGILQEESVDYTISGATLTFTNSFVSGNKVTTRYYS